MAGKSTISITFKLDGDGKGFKELSKDAEGLKEVMRAAVSEAQNLNKSVADWSLSVQAIGAVSGAVSQLNSTFQNLISDSATFGRAMKAANTMAGKTGEGYAQLKDQVADLSKTIPMARDELANGLYQVISNGVPEDNWINYLNTSARSAVGGIADVGEVVKVTSTVIKNYGLEWEAAQDIQDKIQLTAKNGVTSFEQLAAALPSVTGQAAQLGVSFTEMLAVMSTLTGVTGNTSEVATQLASVLTALTKESSKAQSMAEAMGIEFNAASIKAAGGLRNYLKELDATVTAYASKTGQLKESIYSQLFGRAEALRLINGLTGEMADKFDENIKALDNSAGTIDAAFNEMASTGGAVTQMLKNQMAAFTDVIASVVGGISPYLNFTAQLGVTTMSIVSLSKTIKALNIVQGLMAVRSKAAGAAMLLLGLNSTKAAATTRVFSAAMRSGAFSATAFKIALRGLLITTGIGAAIAAVTMVIEYFVNKTDEATEATEDFNEATEAYTSASANAKLEMDKEIKELGKLIESNGDATDTIHHLNEAYGELFGQHKTAAEWYDILTKKSKVYVKQIGYEAQAKVLATKLAEKQIQLEADFEKRKQLWKDGKARETHTQTYVSPTGYSMTTTYETDSDEYKKLKEQDAALIKEIGELQSLLGVAEKKLNECAAEMAAVANEAGNANTELKVSEMTWQQVADAIDKTEKKLKGTTDPAEIKKLKAYNQQLQARKKILDKTLGLEHGAGSKNGKKKVAVADPKTYEELSTNIEIYKKKLTGANTAEQQAIREKIAGWEKAKEAIEQLQAEAARPTSLETLSDIDKELEYQRKLRANANKEAIAGIDAEIKRLTELRAEFERSGKAPLPIEAIHTYDELNEQLSYYTQLLNKATETERVGIQKQINALDELKRKWDAVLDDLKKPGEISTLDTIEKLDEAITYYGNLQKKQSADEIAATQRTIDALEKKREAMQRGIKLPSMQKEIAEINALTGREFKLKIRGMGFDELTAKIRELEKELNDLDHPVTAGQRKDIEQMIAVYEDWRRKSIDGFGEFKKGWDSVKGISSGIQGITDALEGDGNAWQKVTAIVDGFIQLYEGIQTVIGIINLLSAASTAHSIAKGVEAGAETTEAGTRAASTATNIAASAATIAANKLETASWAELAAAMTIAAHAYIPFAGTAIAAGYIAAQQAMILAAGIPKFADGAIAYGPTLGLFGEYAGASNNPEVVAPLDKLRSMIQPQGGISGEIELKIRGRNLVGIIGKENNLTRRS